MAVFRPNDLFRESTMTDVTRILSAIEQGEQQATDELLPLIYEELRRLAARKMSREPAGHTLQATALVHEAFIRLVEAKDQKWSSRGHFFGAAAEAMQRILVENARRKGRLKRGGRLSKRPLDETVIVSEAGDLDLLALDEALKKLALEDPEKAKLVRLRYFAGLTIQQAADLMNWSVATANRHWSYARSWLFQEINKGE